VRLGKEAVKKAGFPWRAARQAWTKYAKTSRFWERKVITLSIRATKDFPLDSETRNWCVAIRQRDEWLVLRHWWALPTVVTNSHSAGSTWSNCRQVRTVLPRAFSPVCQSLVAAAINSSWTRERIGATAPLKSRRDKVPSRT